MGSFSDLVDRGCNEFLSSARRTVHRVAELVGEAAIDGSPVGQPETWKRKPPADYKPGAYKSNWRLKVDGIDDTFDPNRTASFTVSGLDTIPADPFGHRLVFSNAAPYAWRLEKDQWSNQVPGGVVGPVELEFSRIVKQAAAEVRAKPAGPREL